MLSDVLAALGLVWLCFVFLWVLPMLLLIAN